MTKNSPKWEFYFFQAMCHQKDVMEEWEHMDHVKRRSLLMGSELLGGQGDIFPFHFVTNSKALMNEANWWVSLIWSEIRQVGA